MKKHCYEITEIIKQNLKHIVSLRENLSLKPDNSYVGAKARIRLFNEGAS